MPVKLHWITHAILAVVFGAFLYLNGRESPLLKAFDVGGLGDDWNAAARYLFLRGWPLSPWMVCNIHGMKPHPEEDWPWWTLVADALLAVVTLLAVAVVSAWLVKRWGRIHVPTKFVLAIGLAVVLWVNASVPRHVERFAAPTEYGPVTGYLFMRGWPLSPRMFAFRKGDTFLPVRGLFWDALAVDCLVAFDALVLAGFLAECYVRRSRGSQAEP